MRTCSRNPRRGSLVDDYFERKSQSLVVPDDEIEAWELDAQDLESLGTQDGYSEAFD